MLFFFFFLMCPLYFQVFPCRYFYIITTKHSKFVRMYSYIIVSNRYI